MYPCHSTVEDEGSPKEKKSSRPKHRKTRSQTLPTTDAEIETAGTAFLDAIGKSLGIRYVNRNSKSYDKVNTNQPGWRYFSGIGPGTSSGEESRVGQAHHKKTRSRSSIDWSIPNDDFSRLLADTNSEINHTREVEQKSELDESMSTLSKEKEISTKLPNFNTCCCKLNFKNSI